MNKIPPKMNIEGVLKPLATEINKILKSKPTIIQSDIRILSKCVSHFDKYILDPLTLPQFREFVQIYFKLVLRYCECTTNAVYIPTVRMAFGVLLSITEKFQLYDVLFEDIIKMINQIARDYSKAHFIAEFLRIYNVWLSKASPHFQRLLSDEHGELPRLYKILKETHDVEIQSLIIEIILKSCAHIKPKYFLEQLFPEILSVKGVNPSTPSYNHIRALMNKVNYQSIEIFSINCKSITLNGIEIEMKEASDIWLDFDLNQEKLIFFCDKDILHTYFQINFATSLRWETLSFFAKDVLKTKMESYTSHIKLNITLKLDSFNVLANATDNPIVKLTLTITESSENFYVLVDFIIPKMFRNNFENIVINENASPVSSVLSIENVRASITPKEPTNVETISLISDDEILFVDEEFTKQESFSANNCKLWTVNPIKENKPPVIIDDPFNTEIDIIAIESNLSPILYGSRHTEKELMSTLLKNQIEGVQLHRNTEKISRNGPITGTQSPGLNKSVSPTSFSLFKGRDSRNSPAPSHCMLNQSNHLKISTAINRSLLFSEVIKSEQKVEFTEDLDEIELTEESVPVQETIENKVESWLDSVQMCSDDENTILEVGRYELDDVLDISNTNHIHPNVYTNKSPSIRPTSICLIKHSLKEINNGLDPAICEQSHSKSIISSKSTSESSENRRKNAPAEMCKLGESSSFKEATSSSSLKNRREKVGKKNIEPKEAPKNESRKRARSATKKTLFRPYLSFDQSTSSSSTMETNQNGVVPQITKEPLNLLKGKETEPVLVDTKKKPLFRPYLEFTDSSSSKTETNKTENVVKITKEPSSLPKEGINKQITLASEEMSVDTKKSKKETNLSCVDSSASLKQTKETLTLPKEDEIPSTKICNDKRNTPPCTRSSSIHLIEHSLKKMNTALDSEIVQQSVSQLGNSSKDLNSSSGESEIPLLQLKDKLNSKSSEQLSSAIPRKPIVKRKKSIAISPNLSTIKEDSIEWLDSVVPLPLKEEEFSEIAPISDTQKLILEIFGGNPEDNCKYEEPDIIDVTPNVGVRTNEEEYTIREIEESLRDYETTDEEVYQINSKIPEALPINEHSPNNLQETNTTVKTPLINAEKLLSSSKSNFSSDENDNIVKVHEIQLESSTSIPLVKTLRQKLKECIRKNVPENIISKPALKKKTKRANIVPRKKPECSNTEKESSPEIKINKRGKVSSQITKKCEMPHSIVVLEKINCQIPKSRLLEIENDTDSSSYSSINDIINEMEKVEKREKEKSSSQKEGKKKSPIKRTLETEEIILSGNTKTTKEIEKVRNNAKEQLNLQIKQKKSPLKNIKSKRTKENEPNVNKTTTKEVTKINKNISFVESTSSSSSKQGVKEMEDTEKKSEKSCLSQEGKASPKLKRPLPSEEITTKKVPKLLELSSTPSPKESKQESEKVLKISKELSNLHEEVETTKSSSKVIKLRRTLPAEKITKKVSNLNRKSSFLDSTSSSSSSKEGKNIEKSSSKVIKLKRPLLSQEIDKTLSKINESLSFDSSISSPKEKRNESEKATKKPKDILRLPKESNQKSRPKLKRPDLLEEITPIVNTITTEVSKINESLSILDVSSTSSPKEQNEKAVKKMKGPKNTGIDSNKIGKRKRTLETTERNEKSSSVESPIQNCPKRIKRLCSHSDESINVVENNESAWNQSIFSSTMLSKNREKPKGIDLSEIKGISENLVNKRASPIVQKLSKSRKEVKKAKYQLNKTNISSNNTSKCESSVRKRNRIKDLTINSTLGTSRNTTTKRLYDPNDLSHLIPLSKDEERINVEPAMQTFFDRLYGKKTVTSCSNETKSVKPRKSDGSKMKKIPRYPSVSSSSSTEPFRQCIVSLKLKEKLRNGKRNSNREIKLKTNLTCNKGREQKRLRKIPEAVVNVEPSEQENRKINIISNVVIHAGEISNKKDKTDKEVVGVCFQTACKTFLELAQHCKPGWLSNIEIDKIQKA